MLLDEWQAVPGVLGAVKRSLDQLGWRNGRVLVSGSVRDDLLAQSWPVTGRLIRVELSGLGMREIQRGDLTVPRFFDRVESGALVDPLDPPDLVGYLEAALRGGYPEPVLGLSESRRHQWAVSYLDRVMTRDALDVDVPRDPGLLARYFQAYALNTAGEAADRTVYEAAGISRMTAEAYERLLSALLLVESLPAWSGNRLKRLIRAPKRFVRDSALAAAAMGVGLDDVLRDGDILGRLIETFVLMQLRAEDCRYERRPNLFHLRQQGGAHEVDLIAELGHRRLIAMEIKARSAVTRDHARHLIWLRDQLGDAFTAGVVLHTGPRVYQLDERIIAAPIACIWG